MPYDDPARDLPPLATPADVKAVDDEVATLRAEFETFKQHAHTEYADKAHTHAGESVPPPPDPVPLPPPPPPPPPGDVVEPIPGNAIHIDTQAELDAAVASAPAGSNFALHGQFSRFVPKDGNGYWGNPDPNLRTRFIGSGPSVVGQPFYRGNHRDIKLRYLSIKNYGPDENNHNGSVIRASHGVSAPGWDLYDVEVSHTKQNLVRWNDGWKVRSCRFHHAGALGICGGGRGAEKLMVDSETYYCGVTHDGITAIGTSDRGSSKFALTSNTRILRHRDHHCHTGLWFDLGNEKVHIEDYYFHDIERPGLDIEVSYGPFLIIRPRGERIGTKPRNDELTNNWALPPAIIITMTPDVTVIDPMIDGADQGIISHQWNHPQLSGTLLDKSRLGCENVIVKASAPGKAWVRNVTNFTPARRTNGTHSYSAGQTGSQQPGLRPTRNVRWEGLDFDADAKFRSSLHIG